MPLFDLLFGAVLPLLVGFVLSAWAARDATQKGATEAAPARGAWAGAVLLALGYLGMHVHLLGFLEPKEAGDWTTVRTSAWLSWLVPLGAVLGVVVRGQRPALAFGQRFVLLLALLFTQTHPLVLNDGWTPVGKFVGLASYGLALVLLWNGTERTARSEGPAFSFGLVALCATVAAVVTGTSGSGLLAQLLGAFASAAGGAALLGLLLELRGRRPPLAASIAPVVTLALGGVLMAAVLYSRTGRDAAFLCVLPLMVAPVIARTALGQRQTIAAEALRLCVLSVPLAAALLLAWQRYSPDPYGY